MISIPKGTKDMLPKEAYKWHYIEKCAKETAKLFNIREIRTPIFEHTELFLRGVGDTTDIVNKEMYTFNDKGGRSITLKPEGTAGVARAFIENGLYSDAMPLKMFYLTPVFRYERPQAGRLREHHQFGIEIFGSKSASIDAEIILVAETFFKKLGIENLTVNINSIGCKNCRPKYNSALKEYIKDNANSLCDICKQRITTNPLRVLDCKNDQCKEVLKNAPVTTEFLCEECANHFKDLQNYLKLSNVNFVINTKIVRGLDYYTKTVFEFVSNHLGAQSTVCGGGRYDNLIEDLSGKQVAGAGFGIGIERLLLMMENMGINIKNTNYCDVYIAPVGNDSYNYSFNLTNMLRKKGINAETDHMQRSLKSQFKYADKINSKFVITIGSNEIENNIVSIKNMKSGEQKQVDIDLLAEYIKGKKE